MVKSYFAAFPLHSQNVQTKKWVEDSRSQSRQTVVGELPGEGEWQAENHGISSSGNEQRLCWAVVGRSGGQLDQDTLGDE